MQRLYPVGGRLDRRSVSTRPLSWMAAVSVVLLVGAQGKAQPRGPEQAQAIERARTRCRHYMEGFWHPNTSMVYSRRLNTAKGISVLTSPAEVGREEVRGKHMPYGYGSGIQDPGLLNGCFLFALCDAYDATHDPYLEQVARRIFGGLRTIGITSPVPGFVPRGPHPDGKSYYRDSSLDQHSLFVCALWRYYRSPLAGTDDIAFIRRELAELAERMERNRWTLLVEDDSRVAHVGWCWLGMTQLNAEIMLSMLAAVSDATGDPHWRAEYRRFAGEEGGRRWALLAGDPESLPRYTLYSNQNDFRLITLARAEPDPKRGETAVRRVRRRARDMLTANVFTHWRRLDWIGKRPDPVVNEFLAPLGLSLDAEATVGDVWERFDPSWRSPPLSDGTRPWGQAFGLQNPLMAWQVAMLSREPDLVRRTRRRVRDSYSKIDVSSVESGWTANYAVVLSLLDLAAGGWDTDAPGQDAATQDPRATPRPGN